MIARLSGTIYLPLESYQVGRIQIARGHPRIASRWSTTYGDGDWRSLSYRWGKRASILPRYQSFRGTQTAVHHGHQSVRAQMGMLPLACTRAREQFARGRAPLSLPLAWDVTHCEPYARGSRSRSSRRTPLQDGRLLLLIRGCRHRSLHQRTSRLLRGSRRRR